MQFGMYTFFLEGFRKYKTYCFGLERRYMIEDFNNITEDFKSASADVSGDCNESCKPYMNLASKLDMLDKDYTTEKILIERDRTLLNTIKEKMNKLLKATGNPTI